ncbi:hypothetical protein F4802DRAFT_585122 [Xylaria palmicola]|nr:hypothetical protein F4802DRAFT_585122 [Xylaria palmicola]
MFVITPLTIIAVALVPSTWAGEPDLLHQIQSDFRMGILPRQDVGALQIGNTNLNFFTDALGGAPAPPITLSDDPQHPYKIQDEEVSDFNTAIDKTCDFQQNDCAKLANGARKGDFEVSDCDDQKNRCKSSLKASATQTAFLSKVTMPGVDDFEFLCEN